MKLTKLGHACVRLEKDDQVLVIDPGMFTEPEAMEGADGVLITHEHADHFVEERLRSALEASPRLTVHGPGSVAEQLDGYGERVRAVGDGDRFSVAGFEIGVHGTWHEVVHPDIPRVPNVGFLVDSKVFHPGDAFTIPGGDLAVLLLPVHAPWSKVAEVVDYVREVAPQKAIALHDGLLNDRGLSIVDRLLGSSGLAGETSYQRLTSNASIDV